MKKSRLFTSESVSEGHPDKVCDQISDAIIDAILAKDEHARVACETFITKDFVLISGEITATVLVDYEEIARGVLRRIGYTDKSLGIDADSCEVLIKINEQSPDIDRAVSRDEIEKQGAGDQGMMFGYASRETAGLMPLAPVLAHKLMRIATEKRKNGEFKHARPDMKAQVTVRYDAHNNISIDTIIMSVQHEGDIDMEAFRAYVYNEIIVPVTNSFGLNDDFKYYINPGGNFVVGGPEADAGLTGRKIIVDTYGGYARHGGGAFSGKDPSKVDRSGAYMARYIAKNIVAANLASEVEVQLSYAIGVAEPISVALDTFDTANKYDEYEILAAIKHVFDCRAGVMIRDFSLTKPAFAYEHLAALGHFGRPDLNVPWEKVDKVDALLEFLQKSA